MLTSGFVNQKNFTMQNKLGRQPFAVLHGTESTEPAQETDKLPLVREGGGEIPTPLPLTQGATLSAHLLISRRLIRCYAKTCLLGWHAEELTLVWPHIKELRTELIVNR